MNTSKEGTLCFIVSYNTFVMNCTTQKFVGTFNISPYYLKCFAKQHCILRSD